MPLSRSTNSRTSYLEQIAQRTRGRYSSTKIRSQFCAEQTFEEKCAKLHTGLSEDTDHHGDTDGSAGDIPRVILGLDVEALTNEDIPKYAARLLNSAPREMPAEVAAQFDINQQEWIDLSASYQDKLLGIARLLSRASEPSSNSGPFGVFGNIGDVLGGDGVSRGIACV